MAPIPSQDNNEETSNACSFQHNSALCAEDIIKSTLAIVEQHHGQQQAPKPSTYVRSEATGSHGLTALGLPFTPKSSRPSLVAAALLSPAMSDISKDSSDDGDRVWDTPSWDGEDSSGMVNNNILTPLTPPSTSKRVSSAIFTDAESPLQQKTRRQTKFNSDALFESDFHDTNAKCDAEAADGDYFASPKQGIFRVRTLLETIAKSQPQERYASKPDTKFSRPDEMVPEKISLQSTFIKKSKTSHNTFHTIVKSEQSSTTNVEEISSTERSTTRFTTSATLETKMAVPGKTHAPIIPFDVYARTKNSASLCVAFTKSGERCKRQAQGSSAVLCSLKSLAVHYSNQNYEIFLAELKEFIPLALCGGSHRNAAINRITNLESANHRSSSKERCRKSFNDLFGAEDAAVFCSWAESISDLRDPQTRQDYVGKYKISVEASSISDTVTTETRSPIALSAGPVSTSVSSTTKISTTTTTWYSGFHLYRPKTTASQPTSVVLRQTVEADLTPTDLKSGFIYIFWLEGLSFGHLKIGRSNCPLRRLQEWNSQCKHEHVFVQNRVRVPHVSRVERLIHLELKDIRKSMKCAGCQKVHREWFQITEDNAKKVLEKWQDWILQDPYEKDHTGHWRLKPSSRTTIADICQPLPLAAKPLKSIGPKKYKSPSPKPIGPKKYKNPQRKISDAQSLGTSTSKGHKTKRDDGLLEHELPGDGLRSDDRVDYTISAKLRASSGSPKPEVETQDRRIKNQSHPSTSITATKTEEIKDENYSALIEIAAVAKSRKLWFQRLSQMRTCISQGVGKCVATTKLNQRCSSKTPGSRHDIDGILKAWSKCLEDENYTAVPTLVKRFFESAVCGKQKLARKNLLERFESLNEGITGSDYDRSEYASAVINVLRTESALWPRLASNHH